MMNNEVLTPENMGVPFCMNCVGWHPDQLPTMVDAVKKFQNPQKDVWAQQQAFDQKRLTLYANKSCSLCGRTYKENGELDTSWEMTAKRVHDEFAAVGIQLDDPKVKHIVAKCRKAVQFLFENRLKLMNIAIEENKAGNPNAMMNIQKWTFSGHLAFIMTHAIEAKKLKGGFDDIPTLGGTR